MHSISIQCNSYHYQMPYGTLSSEMEIKLEIQLINKVLGNIVVNIDYPKPVLIRNLTSVTCSVLKLVKPSSLPCRNVISDEYLLAWINEIIAKLGTSCIYPHKWVVASACVKKTNICLTDLLCQEPKMPLTYRILSAFVWIQSTGGYVICNAINSSNNISVQI